MAGNNNNDNGIGAGDDVRDVVAVPIQPAVPPPLPSDDISASFTDAGAVNHTHSITKHLDDFIKANPAQAGNKVPRMYVTHLVLFRLNLWSVRRKRSYIRCFSVTRKVGGHNSHRMKDN